LYYRRNVHGMSTEHKPIHTVIATVHRTAPDLVEVRCNEEAIWTMAAIAELMQARATAAQGVPVKILVVLPEVVDFEMNTMLTEHYPEGTDQAKCLAEAWAVRNAFNEKLARLYFGYFPSPVPFSISMTEQEARAWLEQR